MSGGSVFDDGKSPDALRTIGEVARTLKIRPHVLRYWEDQFPTLQPVKRSGGRRYYRPEDISLIETISRLVHKEGYTLRGARQAIHQAARSRPEVATAARPPRASENPESVSVETLDRLSDIRRRLETALNAA